MFFFFLFLISFERPAVCHYRRTGGIIGTEDILMLPMMKKNLNEEKQKKTEGAR